MLAAPTVLLGYLDLGAGGVDRRGRLEEERMRSPLVLLTGFLLGVVVLLAFQGVTSAVGQNPVVNLVHSLADRLNPGPAPAATPAPAPTPAPSPTPRVIQIDLERARMVHKTTYSEMGYTVHLTSQEPAIVIFDRGLFQKEMLVIVSGVCRAGIDYEATPARIQQSGTRVSVTIPEPEISGCDVSSVEYFDGKGIFPAKTEQYNALYRDAIQRIEDRAGQSDLLDRAATSAVSQIKLHLYELGFEDVSVTIEPAL
jgi:hypothetical protein